MPWIKIKASPTITSYFPQLLRKEWWYGVKNIETGSVTLIQEQGADPLPTAFTGLVIAQLDIEAESQTNPKKTGGQNAGNA